MTLLSDVPDDFKPTILDLVLATTAAIGLPVAAGLLFNVTGALIPLLLYYGVFSWAIVRWRRGGVGYEIRRGDVRNQFRGYVTSLFVVMLLLQLALVGIEWITAERVTDFNLAGFIVTLLIWAPVNAFSEQLIWIYTFDSYAEFFQKGPKRSIMIGIGGVLYIIFIGMIHALFWGLFLEGSKYVFPFSELFIPIQMLISIGYIFLYRQAKSMWPLGLNHVIINLTAIAFSGFSILPYLLVFG